MLPKLRVALEIRNRLKSDLCDVTKTMDSPVMQNRAKVSHHPALLRSIRDRIQTLDVARTSVTRRRHAPVETPLRVRKPFSKSAPYLEVANPRHRGACRAPVVAPESGTCITDTAFSPKSSYTRRDLYLELRNNRPLRIVVLRHAPPVRPA